MNKLPKCPCCDGEMKIFESAGDCGGAETDGFYVTHKDIGTTCPLDFGPLDNKYDLIKKWNKLLRNT